MELFGFFLWEGITLLFVFLTGMGILTLRRLASGRPGFTAEDRQLYFADLNLNLSFPRICIRLFLAAAACLAIGTLENFVFAQFGAGLLTAVFVLTSFSIVRFALR